MGEQQLHGPTGWPHHRSVEGDAVRGGGGRGRGGHHGHIATRWRRHTIFDAHLSTMLRKLRVDVVV